MRPEPTEPSVADIQEAKMLLEDPEQPDVTPEMLERARAVLAARCRKRRSEAAICDSPQALALGINTV